MPNNYSDDSLDAAMAASLFFGGFALAANLLDWPAEIQYVLLIAAVVFGVTIANWEAIKQKLQGAGQQLEQQFEPLRQQLRR